MCCCCCCTDGEAAAAAALAGLAAPSAAAALAAGALKNDMNLLAVCFRAVVSLNPVFLCTFLSCRVGG